MVRFRSERVSSVVRTIRRAFASSILGLAPVSRSRTPRHRLRGRTAAVAQCRRPGPASGSSPSRAHGTKTVIESAPTALSTAVDVRRARPWLRSSLKLGTDPVCQRGRHKASPSTSWSSGTSHSLAMNAVWSTRRSLATPRCTSGGCDLDRHRARRFAQGRGARQGWEDASRRTLSYSRMNNASAPERRVPVRSQAPQGVVDPVDRLEIPVSSKGRRETATPDPSGTVPSPGFVLLDNQSGRVVDESLRWADPGVFRAACCGEGDYVHVRRSGAVVLATNGDHLRVWYPSTMGAKTIAVSLP